MPTAPIASSPRLDWAGVPEPVRRSVEAELGSSIVSTVTQVGGFSPGAAVRAVLADGRRVFVKACGSALNKDTPDLNRAEIHALELLPPSVPAPRLLTSYDDGDWVALVLEDIEGRRPDLPWTPEDVTSMTTSLGRVASTAAPAALRTFAVATNVLTGWDEVEADPVGLDREVVRRLPEMLEHQALAGDVTVGSALVHWDARNDNVLVRPGGEAVLLDWAWACSGAPWLDTLLLALDFVVQGGPEPHDFLRTATLTRDIPRPHLRAVLACVIGIWTDRARRPPPPGLPRSASGRRTARGKRCTGWTTVRGRVDHTRRRADPRGTRKSPAASCRGLSCWARLLRPCLVSHESQSTIEARTTPPR